MKNTGYKILLAVLSWSWASTVVGAQTVQYLPITAKVQLGSQTVNLEVARTSQEMMIGLMGRKDIPADRGMLFMLPQPQYISFWMAHCYTPIDMVFIQQGKIASLTEKAKPCPEAKNCPLYPSKVMVDQVLELRAGQISALKLKVKDPVPVSFLASPIYLSPITQR